MIARNLKYIKPHSTYKYVYEYYCTKCQKTYWGFSIRKKYKGRGTSVAKCYKTDKEAAKIADIFLIRQNKQPVNILKLK